MATITVTPTQTFVSGNTVTPATLNQLAQSTVALTAGSIVAADIADAAVTTAKLATVTAQSLLPAGAVMPFARATAPAGWLIANGDAVPNGSGTVQGVTADFAALHAAVSTSFGTAGTLPDLRGYFVRGSGTNSDGTAAGTFGAKQSQDTQPHTHGITDPSHNHVWNAVNGPAGQNFGVNYVGGIASISGNTGYSVNSSVTGITINNSTGTETRPKNIAMLYCIKF